MTQCRETDQTKSGSQTWRIMLLITEHVQSFCSVKMLQGILISVLRLKTFAFLKESSLKLEQTNYFMF